MYIFSVVLFVSGCVYCGFPHVLECEFYDPTVCDVPSPDERCHLGTNCDPSSGRPAHCMAQWTNQSGVIQVMGKYIDG